MGLIISTFTSPSRGLRARDRRFGIARQSAGVVALLLLSVPAGTHAQPTRATLHVKWTADSSWEGTYYQKPHRFHIHEELEGRLVFELTDAAFLSGPVARAAESTAPVRAIQLREDGTAVNATLIDATGTTSYRADVSKEGGDCTALTEGAAESLSLMGPPYAGREEASGSWDARAPGPALIVFRGTQPIDAAFSPKSLTVESGHRLLCEKPETVRKVQRYRVTARIARVPAGPQWSIDTSAGRDGATTTTARYRAVVTQDRAAAGDPSAATGRLEVTKTFVYSWQPGGR